MIAIKLSDGRYVLRSELLGGRDTYFAKEKIKRLGGVWDRIARHWTVPPEAVDQLRAKRLYGVIRESFCHTPLGFTFVDQEEVDRLLIRRAFCNYCDSHFANWRVTIIEICGETDVARQVYEEVFMRDVEGR
jgi:hypothetical protein